MRNIEKKILSEQVTDIIIPITRAKGWEQWILLQSDEHFDSKHCDRNMLKRHHEEAKERDALIMKFGDVFDMMGGKYDPRSHKGDVRPEYQRADYFTAVEKDAAKFYKPYKDNIKFISTGNHEASVLKRHEVDILGGLAERLGQEMHQYNGFIRLIFKRPDGIIEKTFTIYYTHGSGGSAPVTRGVIKTNRRQTYIHADILISGHIHNQWTVPLPYVELSNKGVVKKKEQLHISLSTYKDDSFTGGWADTKEFAPPSKGGMWLRFSYDKQSGIKLDTLRAQ